MTAPFHFENFLDLLLRVIQTLLYNFFLSFFGIFRSTQEFFTHLETSNV